MPDNYQEFLRRTAPTSALAKAELDLLSQPPEPPTPSSLDFAAGGAKKCKKGLACGGSCIAPNKKCKRTLSPTQAAYAEAVTTSAPEQEQVPETTPPTPEDPLDLPAEPETPPLTPEQEKDRELPDTTPKTHQDFIKLAEDYLGDTLTKAESVLADLSARYAEAVEEKDSDKLLALNLEMMRSPELTAISNKVLEVTKPDSPEYQAASAAAANLTVDSSAVTEKLTEQYYRETMTKVFALAGNQGVDLLDTIKYTRDTPSASQIERRLNVGKLDEDPYYKTRDIFHEAGHFVEFSNPNAKAAALGFVKERATGELTELSKMGYKSADPNAKAYPMPAGTASYMGRVYADGSTEVLSMGIERMTNQFSMNSFMADDRQHFLFTLGVLRSGK